LRYLSLLLTVNTIELDKISLFSKQVRDKLVELSETVQNDEVAKHTCVAVMNCTAN